MLSQGYIRVFSVFLPVGGSGAYSPQEILKISCSEMLFSAISVICLLRSLVVHILYSDASNIDGSIHLLFMILLAISRCS